MEEITPRWFRATDVPIKDDTPFKTSRITAKPLVWEAFNEFDSDQMEIVFKEKSCYLPIEFDCLFEANLKSREFYAVYWQAATFEIRRGIWFEPAAKTSGYSPCDENLTNQIEDGYRKFMSIKETMDEKAYLEWRWPLLGPYLNKFVSYTNSSVAYLQTDDVTSKITRALTRTAGVKIYRGWNNVLAKASVKPVRSSTAQKSDPSEAPAPTESPEAGPTANMDHQNLEQPKEPRKIEHLILAVHGIGQKLSAHVDAMSFSKDCQIFRESLFAVQENFKASLNAQKLPIPDNLPPKCTIQVLPIHWRHKLTVSLPRAEDEVDEGDIENKELTLADILPEGIPGIRTLLSDVVLDVMLYMTPKYRNQIISIVSKELNRVYSVFKERHPNFNGTVSIYGHSLGSVIAYDISTRQGTTSSFEDSIHNTPATGVDISDISSSAGSPRRRLSGPEVFTPSINIEKLDFSIDHLFSVGSPIGMFLLLGGYTIRPASAPPLVKSSRPVVKALYNIFHAYDPVAHRLEPLFSPIMATLKPYQVPYTKGGLTQTMMGVSQAGSEVLERGKRVFSGIYTSTTSMMMSLAKNIPSPEEIEMNAAGTGAGNSGDIRRSIGSHERISTTTNEMPKPALLSEPNNSHQAVIERLIQLNPNGRLDYVLQEAILENPYISSLGVHMSYWNDQDVNLLVLKSLYKLIPS